MFNVRNISETFKQKFVKPQIKGLICSITCQFEMSLFSVEYKAIASILGL